MLDRTLWGKSKSSFKSSAEVFGLSLSFVSVLRERSCGGIKISEKAHLIWPGLDEPLLLLVGAPEYLSN